MQCPKAAWQKVIFVKSKHRPLGHGKYVSGKICVNNGLFGSLAAPNNRERKMVSGELSLLYSMEGLNGPLSFLK